MPGDAALRPLAPGARLRIASERLAADVAPLAGGRIAQAWFDGRDWLVGHDDAHAAALAWGCYPMLPWAGRLRRGEFPFRGQRYRLPANLGAHAIHGVGFAVPWQVESQSPERVELSLRLPQDDAWPFGGTARQAVSVEGDALALELSVTAGDRAMPSPVIGWHPWFAKPDGIEFAPRAHYPRDAEGIATLPLAAPPAGPWDDCFVHDRPVLLHRSGRRLRLSSNCDHWVVFDEPAHATCVEPQSGPPDAFNLLPAELAPGESVSAWFRMEWD